MTYPEVAPWVKGLKPRPRSGRYLHCFEEDQVKWAKYAPIERDGIKGFALAYEIELYAAIRVATLDWAKTGKTPLRVGKKTMAWMLWAFPYLTTFDWEPGKVFVPFHQEWSEEYGVHPKQIQSTVITNALYAK